MTLVHVTATHEGKEYRFAVPMYGADMDEVFGLFSEGDYDCDCNLSDFIRETYPAFPDLDCGDTIVVRMLTMDGVIYVV